MAGNFSVVEIGQDYLDWATKLRQENCPNAGRVTHDEVGRYAVQYPDGAVAADGFTNRKVAEEYARRLEDEDSRPEDQWCVAWVDCYGTEGIEDPAVGFTELKAVTIVFTYPLTRKAKLEFKSEAGFTRAEIIECIRSGYRKIYAENALSGKWGIWGHEMGDLLIESVEVDDDTGLVNLGIGS